MSTAQTILDLLQYRPDIQVNSDDLVHIVNQAVRAISKRLYVLGSDLITGQMEVKVFAEQTYTASMAMTASSSGVAGTITDAANQFVVESFAAGMPITTNHASNPGPLRIATVAVGTLTFALTDTVVAVSPATSIAITSDDAYGYLPSDFWGLRDKFEPYLEGYTTPLLPLPSQAVALQYATPGHPLYYKLRGSRIYVTPHAAADVTIIADYYQQPTAITASTSTIPWNELFDDLIAEYTEIYFRGPQSKSGNTVNILDKLIKDGVDTVAVKYDRKGAVDFPQAVDWNAAR